MKRLWSGVIAAAVAATVGLGAQGAPGTQSPSPSQEGAAQGREQSRPAAQSGERKIMVTGCVQSAPAASTATGAAGAGARTPAAADAENFVLTNAKMASGAGAPGTAVGTSGTASSRYELDGDSKTLTGHIGHQVEITGTLESSSSSPAAGAATPGTSSRTAAADPTLKVDSVKMVSAKCT